MTPFIGNRTTRLTASIGGILWIGLILLGARHDFWTAPLGPITYERYNRLLTLPLLLFVVGWSAIHLRYAKRELLGRITSLVVLGGFVLLLAGNVLEFWAVLFQTSFLPFRLDQGNPWPGAMIGWTLFLIGSALSLLGLMVFGSVTLHFRLLPRWNAALFCASIFGLILAVAASSLGSSFDRTYTYLLLGLGVHWLLLAYALNPTQDATISIVHPGSMLQH